MDTEKDLMSTDEIFFDAKHWECNSYHANSSSDPDYTDLVLSLGDPPSNPPCLAQQVNMTTDLRGGEHDMDGPMDDTPVTGEGPMMITGESPISADDIFFDVLDTGEQPDSSDDLFFFDPLNSILK